MNNFAHERDPKVNFNYNGNEKSSFISSNSQIGTPHQSKISTVEINNQQFIPKIIESGYIVGPPVAYSRDPLRQFALLLEREQDVRTHAYYERSFELQSTEARLE
mgnify:CR=1 FL=1